MEFHPDFGESNQSMEQVLSAPTGSSELDLEHPPFSVSSDGTIVFASEQEIDAESVFTNEAAIGEGPTNGYWYQENNHYGLPTIEEILLGVEDTPRKSRNRRTNKKKNPVKSMLRKFKRTIEIDLSKFAELQNEFHNEMRIQLRRGDLTILKKFWLVPRVYDKTSPQIVLRYKKALNNPSMGRKYKAFLTKPATLFVLWKVSNQVCVHKLCSISQELIDASNNNSDNTNNLRYIALMKMLHDLPQEHFQHIMEDFDEACHCKYGGQSDIDVFLH